MKQNLKGVPERMLIPLWAKTVELENLHPIVKDYKAVEIMEQIITTLPNLIMNGPLKLA